MGVSLGSSTRDSKVKVELLGEEIEIERRGTDGSVSKMMEIYQEFDGKVDASALGGQICTFIPVLPVKDTP